MFNTELGSYSLTISLFNQGQQTKFLGQQKGRGSMTN